MLELPEDFSPLVNPPRDVHEPATETFGCLPQEGAVQRDYDAAAFIARLPASQTGHSRSELFARCSDRWTPGYFEWHEWTIRLNDALCSEKEFVGITGMASCVSGDTRILNPLTGELPTIKHLCENGIAPTVMTLNGPEVAGVPFVKGVADLFKVTLLNGSSFVATGEHRVLLSDANATTPRPSQFCHVSELKIGQSLLSYDASRLRSNAALGPSIHCPPDYSSICSSYGISVSQSRVASISHIGKSTYYDMEVPKAHHYFHDSIISHNSGKTHNIMGWVVNWWLMDPEASSVIIVSTTKPALRLRAWAKVDRCYRLLADPKPGHYIASEMQWRSTKTDAEHVIMGRAVDEGAVDKIAADIKGHHTDRQIIVIEEATAVKPAIWDAAYNLWLSPHTEFKIIVSCNLNSWIHSAGRFFEPLHGINSVTVDDAEWETKPFIGSKPGLALHFDGYHSPNLIHGRLVSRWLPTQEKIESAITQWGNEHSPLFWENVRGFPPPVGVLATVFTEALLHSGNAFGEPFQFTGPTFVVGGFDPNGSFDGDKPAIRFARCGPIAEGSHGIQLAAPLTVPLDANSKTPHTHQLAQGAIALCREYGCPIENLAIDCSGNNSGVADNIQQLSGNPIRVNFQERASADRCVSPEDPTLCCDKYRDRVTEIWFTAAQFVSTSQVRGLDKPTANDLIQRCFFGGGSNQKIYLEPKSKSKSAPSQLSGYKQRLGHSPDDADAACLCLEAARKRGAPIRRLGLTQHASHHWQAIAQSYQAVHENVDYQPEPAADTFLDSDPNYTPPPQSDWEQRIFG